MTGMNYLKDILAAIGIVAIGIVIIVFVMLLTEEIGRIIDNLKYEYRYKHRFDKSPIAKCYCVDCKYYDNETHRCYGFHEDSNRLVADNMFCYRAEPREREK